MAASEAGAAWAAWLKAELTTSGLSQAELARRLAGIVDSDSTISKWIKGLNPPKLVETVIAVAHAVGAADAVAALDAAGMDRTADLIRQVRTEQGADPMLLRIRTDRIITPDQRADIEESYLRRQAETLRDFELRLADAQARSLQRRPAPAAPPPRARAGRSRSAWTSYLERALTDARMTSAEVAARSERTIPERALDAWLAGTASPTAMEAVFTARILGGDEVEALRAAGYPREADEADRRRAGAAEADGEERNGRAS